MSKLIYTVVLTGNAMARSIEVPSESGRHLFNDGGRIAAGYKGFTGDCVTRAIAIATGKPYQEVYDALKSLTKVERITKRRTKHSNVRLGVRKDTYRKYLTSIGWVFTPTMTIGSGCKVHLRASELPPGRLAA
jgi:hypothetical protein